MLRLLICSATIVCGTAVAAPPADSLHSGAAFGLDSPTASAPPDQVFPPLPSLASLPHSANGDDEAPASASVRHSKKFRHAPVKKPPEFQVHLVVTGESRAALAAVDKQLDALIENGARDRRVTGQGASSIAMSP
nr:hypothetical protein [Burkholderia guangdongensis]